jgi:protein transport protein SEC20
LTNSKQQTSAHSESDLISEIHDNLKAEDEELDILRQELQDSTYSEATFRAGSEREKEQAALAVQVARLGEDFKQFVGLI